MKMVTTPCVWLAVLTGMRMEQSHAFSTAVIHPHRIFCVRPSSRSSSRCRSRQAPSVRVTGSSSFSAAFESTQVADGDARKGDLLELIAAVPRNRATPRLQTRALLEAVRRLEPACPTADKDVLTASAGPWELVWTAQDNGDDSSTRSQQRSDRAPLSVLRWVNPLENQSYSNNPRGGETSGRANPLLPLPVQEWLTKRGVLTPDDDATARTSTQTIDIKNGRVLNVVSLPVRGAKPIALTVRVDFAPHGPTDPRRINVKFQSFQVAWTGRLNLNLPLGLIGPTGWLRTTYIDEGLRVTRGHKGSVFVLRRRGS
jgi:hypothetical protein